MSSCDKETVQDCLCITNTVVEVLASTLQTTPIKVVIDRALYTSLKYLKVTII